MFRHFDRGHHGHSHPHPHPHPHADHPHDDWAAAGERGRGRGRGGFPGGPGGFGGPGGPGGFGGMPWDMLGHLFGRGRGGRGHRARRGDIRAGILSLLAEQPRNGYQIMQELEQRSQGAWRPSSGSIYPALAQLEDEGLVQEDKTGSGRVFHLTATGKTYVAKHKDELRAPWEAAAEPGNDTRWELMRVFRDLAPAAMQVMQTGTPAQIEDAKRLLLDARRALYRILATEPPPSESGDDDDLDEG
jgi:DNA-binding PadR family transcriptional regulator